MHDKHIRNLVRSLIFSLLPLGATVAGPVNLNSADASTLAKELDGVGPAKAQAIVEYRQKNGPFKSAEDLLKVEGIGGKVLEQNRSNIRLGGGTAAPVPAAKAAPKSAKPASSSANR
jgi:competence protein ComEA